MYTPSEWRDQCRNRLFTLLPDSELLDILPTLEIVEFYYKEVLVKRMCPIVYVYFPCNCISSIVAETTEGDAVEIGAVGNEGMTSVMAFLGGTIAIETIICQIPGTAARLPVEQFGKAVQGDTAFRRICTAYAQVYLSTATQSLVCNRFHPINRRLARWLLMSHDRVGRDEFPVTQDFMATMLGCHRPTVSLAAKILMDEGLIQYMRGQMLVLNRAGLEAAACECYQFTRNQFQSIMGLHIG